MNCASKFQKNCDEPVESLFNLVKIEFDCCEAGGIDASFEPLPCDCEDVLWQKWVKIKACCGCVAQKSCFEDLPNYLEGDSPTFIAALNAEDCLVKLPSDTNLDAFIQVQKDVVTGQTKIGLDEEALAEWLVCNLNAGGIVEVPIQDVVLWLGLSESGCLVSFDPPAITAPTYVFDGQQQVVGVLSNALQAHSFNFPAAGVYSITASFTAEGNVSENLIQAILPGGAGTPPRTWIDQTDEGTYTTSLTWQWTYPIGVQAFVQTLHSNAANDPFTHNLKLVIWRTA